MNTIKLLALSGSLRKASYNTASIAALARLAPEHVDLVQGRIGELPLFNPDLEGSPIPALAELKNRMNTSDGLIIASPEYAHGISGPLKNALDWLVSGEEFPNMPVMLINTSPRATHAIAALKEVLATMTGRIMEEACVSIPLLGSGLDVDGIVADREISDALRSGLNRFCGAIESPGSSRSIK